MSVLFTIYTLFAYKYIHLKIFFQIFTISNKLPHVSSFPSHLLPSFAFDGQEGFFVPHILHSFAFDDQEDKNTVQSTATKRKIQTKIDGQQDEKQIPQDIKGGSRNVKQEEKQTSLDFYNRLLGDMANEFIPLNVVLTEDKIQEEYDMEMIGTQIVPHRRILF
ncbi:uncharacterized protein LOC120079276 [Benincasa hispida]|uniref:uncharacterized protein LOC120079276 n=1 Tax=Benincasa hispida TaxID=102211 RepID=UPI001900CD26|nr:uncharacterized protein LOC120079276 [Benincasa hispida]